MPPNIKCEQIKYIDEIIEAGHATFSDYAEMVRIVKSYVMPMPCAPVSSDLHPELKMCAKKMIFSSYPGVAGSTDDWYVTDTGMLFTETTISMYFFKDWEF